MHQPFLKFIKTIFFLTIIVISPLLLGRLCRIATDGFAVVRIMQDLPKDSVFSPPLLSNEESQKITGILSQPFHYLSCGGQCYVFISEDHKHVIKFFKFHHLRLPYYQKNFLLTKFLKKKRDQKEIKLKKMLTSILISFNYLKEESGLVYHHLQQTSNLRLPLIFFDKIGNKFTLDADKYAFVIQKTGTPASLYLKNLVEENRLDEAYQKIDELIHFSIMRAKKGICDRDFKFRSNIGFIDEKPAQLDLGSLLLDPSEKEPNVYIRKIAIAENIFKKWLKKECPVLIKHFDEQIELLNEHTALL